MVKKGTGCQSALEIYKYTHTHNTHMCANTCPYTHMQTHRHTHTHKQKKTQMKKTSTRLHQAALLTAKPWTHTEMSTTVFPGNCNTQAENKAHTLT